MSTSCFEVEATPPTSTGETPSAGNHPAVLVGLIDLGTQDDTYQGEPRTARKVLLVWELTSEKLSTGKRNHVMAKQFTLSFHPKASLRKYLESWRGKPYPEAHKIDIRKTLDQPGLLNVVHKSSAESVYASVDGLTPVPRGMQVPPRQLPLLIYEIASGAEPPAEDWVPWSFGESVKDIVTRSPEYRALHGGTAPANGKQPAPAEQQAPAREEEIPF